MTPDDLRELAEKRRWAIPGAWRVKRATLRDRLNIFRDGFSYLGQCLERGFLESEVTTVVDENGGPVFNPRTLEYIAACGAITPREYEVLAELLEAARLLSRLDMSQQQRALREMEEARQALEALEAIKAAEETQKNRAKLDRWIKEASGGGI